MSKETFQEAETLNNRSLSDFLPVSLVSPSFHELNRRPIQSWFITNKINFILLQKTDCTGNRSTWVGCENKTVKEIILIFHNFFLESHKFSSAMLFHLDFVRKAVCMMCGKFCNKNLSASPVLLIFCGKLIIKVFKGFPGDIKCDSAKE